MLKRITSLAGEQKQEFLLPGTDFKEVPALDIERTRNVSSSESPVQAGVPTFLRTVNVSPFVSWMLTFIGFPAGGLVAKLIIGRVDTVGAGLAGGAVTGIILGAVQWLALRRKGLSWPNWVAATGGGFAVGLSLGAAVVDFRTNPASLATQGAICGLSVGAAQAVVLFRHLRSRTFYWPPLLTCLWALGWTITAAAGIDVEAQYTVFGSSGAIVVTAITSIVVLTLADRKRSGS
jgi:hypothetical protein